MEVLDVIRNRRTVRKFRSDPLPEDVKNRIFEAAMWAPSHRNEQPWEFYVVGPETRRQLLDLFQNAVTMLMKKPETTEIAKKNMEKLKDDFGGAPIMAAVLARPADEHVPDFENSLAAATAVENMLLQAEAENVRSVWLTVGSTPPARNILQVPDNYKVIALLAMGYPDEEPPAPPREDYKDHLKELP